MNMKNKLIVKSDMRCAFAMFVLQIMVITEAHAGGTYNGIGLGAEQEHNNVAALCS